MTGEDRARDISRRGGWGEAARSRALSLASRSGGEFFLGGQDRKKGPVKKWVQCQVLCRRVSVELQRVRVREKVGTGRYLLGALSADERLVSSSGKAVFWCCTNRC